MKPLPIKPWLSILVPVYNVEKYLAECMASVLSQCDAGIEIVLLDDQSNDESFQLANQIAANTKLPVKVIQQEKNSGISAVRNRLIAEASGEYLWFIDSDDVIEQGTISRLRNIIDEHSPDLIMCDYCLWRTEEKELSKHWRKERHIASFHGAPNTLQTNPIQLFAGMYKKGKLHIWSKIFKRELWSSALTFPDGKYFEDMAVSPLLALEVKRYYYVPEVWVYYRQRAGSILAVPSLKKVEDMTAGIDGVWQLWQQKYPQMNSSARFIFVSYCVKVFFFALKELKKLDLYNEEKIEHFRKLLFKNTQCTRRQLISLYLMRGEFFRLIKLLRYV
jgi:glycosyltransferase involved in cell wall biosynthesis